MGSQSEDILPFVGPRQRSDGNLEFFGCDLIHLVEQAMVQGRVALEGLPEDFNIPRFMAHLRRGLSVLLSNVTVNGMRLTDTFSDDDILDFYFLLDDPERSADLVVFRVGVDLFDPMDLAGDSQLRRASVVCGGAAYVQSCHVVGRLRRSCW